MPSDPHTSSPPVSLASSEADKDEMLAGEVPDGILRLSLPPRPPGGEMDDLGWDASPEEASTRTFTAPAELIELARRKQEERSPADSRRETGRPTAPAPADRGAAEAVEPWDEEPTSSGHRAVAGTKGGALATGAPPVSASAEAESTPRRGALSHADWELQAADSKAFPVRTVGFLVLAVSLVAAGLVLFRILG